MQIPCRICKHIHDGKKTVPEFVVLATSIPNFSHLDEIHAVSKLVVCHTGRQGDYSHGPNGFTES